jgi:Ca-activated chloride channel homolog
VDFVADLFALPWVLLALPLLLLLPRGRGRALRAAALAALVVALAQPQLPADEDRIAVLIDVSSSVGDAARTATEPLLTSVGEDAAVYLFAGDTSRVASPQSPTPPGIDVGRSDLGRAVAVAVADGARRILLLSDGVDTTPTGPGGAVSAPNARSATAVPIDVLPVARRANARLEALWAPERVGPGASVEVVAVVSVDRPTRLVLRPDVDGALQPALETELAAGRHALPFQVVAPLDGAGATGGGLMRVGATVEVDFEQPTEDDRQSTEVVVSARSPVLVIGDPAMAQLLRVQGIDVEEGGTERVVAPFDPSAVVLRAGAGSFAPGQLELLARYVDQGGGLLMTGGPEAFGLGGWYRTPVEAVMPVASDVRTEVTVPQVAMVMVLDISMSMSAGNPSRLELAKQGVIDVVDLAYQDDLLGLIVFSDPSLTRWVFELRPATDSGKRAMLESTLAIQAQGGTVLKPGYTMAIDALRDTEAAVKHIIVLSDGKLFDGMGPFGGGDGSGAPDWRLLAGAARAQRITTSAIAIGSDADVEALQALAAAGSGRFYEAFDVRTLPRLFTAEALTASRDLLRDEPVAPEGRRHPLSAFEGSAPALDAYVATTLKPNGEALFLGLDGEPVLAVGRAGLGRSAAFTSDLNAWAGDFGRWDALPGLLGGVVRWLQSRPAPYTASVTPRGATLEVVVDAVDGGAYVNDRPLVARFQGEEAALQQIAPGRYLGRLPVRGSGGTVVVSDGADVVARRSVATPDPEFADVDGARLLGDLAARSGGEVVHPERPYAPPGAAAAAPMWAWPALLALLLALIEFAWRRYGPDDEGSSSGASTSTFMTSRKRVVA